MKSMEQPTSEHEPKKTEEVNLSRRSFLKKAGLAIVAATAASSGLEGVAKAAESFVATSPANYLEREKMIKNWHEYKKVVKEFGVRENIEIIEGLYGQESGMTFVAGSNLQLFDQLVKLEESGEDLMSPENKSLLEAALLDFNLLWDKRAFDEIVKREEKEKGLTAKISGFENLEGLDNEKVRKTLEEKFDKRWLYGNISSFDFLPREEKRKTFRVAGTATNEGLNGIFFKGGGEKVSLYQTYEGQRNIDGNSLLSVLSHEIAHHQDWGNNNRLPIQERLQFLREISDLYGDSQFYSRYVETIIPGEFSDKSPQFIKYRQIIEFWAVLNEEYDIGFITQNDFLREAEFIKKWRKRLTDNPE